jgi:hypothetical protein
MSQTAKITSADDGSRGSNVDANNNSVSVKDQRLVSVPTSRCARESEKPHDCACKINQLKLN